MNHDIVKPDEGPQQEQETAAPPEKRFRMIFFMLLIGLLAIAALSLTGFLYYTTDKLKSGNRNYHQQTAAQLQSIEDVVHGLADKNRGLADAVDELSSSQEQIADSLQSLYQNRRESGRDWTLAEIEYLLIVAVQRLALEGDVKTALAAMQTADNRLQDLSDPLLLPVRKQLATDMNALRSVAEVDISGLGLYLADIISRVEALPLKEIHTGETTARAETAAQEDQGDVPAWRKILTVSWRELKDLVKISKEGQELTISLLPEERYYLRQNLRLQLETARLSVMRRDTDNLHASINLINDWLVKYFDTANAGVNSILETLNRMKEIELTPPLPDIKASLDALRALNQNGSASTPGFTEETGPSDP